MYVKQNETRATRAIVEQRSMDAQAHWVELCVARSAMDASALIHHYISACFRFNLLEYIKQSEFLIYTYSRALSLSLSSLFCASYIHSTTVCCQLFSQYMCQISRIQGLLTLVFVTIVRHSLLLFSTVNVQSIAHNVLSVIMSSPLLLLLLPLPLLLSMLFAVVVVVVIHFYICQQQSMIRQFLFTQVQHPSKCAQHQTIYVLFRVKSNIFARCIHESIYTQYTTHIYLMSPIRTLWEFIQIKVTITKLLHQF